MWKVKHPRVTVPWAGLVTTGPGACDRIWLRHYRAAMAKVGDLLHQALLTADRPGNPFEVMVGVDGGVVQVPAAQMVMTARC